MTADDAIPPCCVRPPWPDELPRIAATFSKFVLAQAVSPLALVTAAGGVERIVGVAGVTDPVDGIAGFSLAARPRFLHRDGLRPLIEAAVTLARNGGATALVTVDDLRIDDARLAALRQEDFETKGQQEYWSVDVAALSARVERRPARPDTTDRPEHFRTVPLADEHLTAVRTLMTAETLLDRREIILATESAGSGFDPNLSFVVTVEGSLAGVVLARRSGKETILVEAVAVARAWRTAPNWAHLAMARTFVQAASKSGGKRVVFSVDPKKPGEPMRMARRTAGRLLGEYVQLGRMI